MAQKSKKSRFGNPAKAAADAAVRGRLAASSADVRLERAMASLSPGFVQWLELQSRPDQSIDASLMILDDFFDMYRMVEPHTDPTALVPEAVREVMATAGNTNPLATLGLRGGMQDYADYLSQAGLWTGTPDDFAAVKAELARTALAGADFDNRNDDDFLNAADYTFADVYIPELTREEILETVLGSPLWKNTVALLHWIGDGKEVTEGGELVDQAGAAATLIHSGLGTLGEAAKFTTPQEHDAGRLSLYWEAFEVVGLIFTQDTRVHPTERAAVSLVDNDIVMETMRDLMSHFIFILTLVGSDNDDHGPLRWDMADWLIQSASRNPPEAAPLLQALAAPESVHPDLVSMAQHIAVWADEGLVTVGRYVEVPPAYRPDVVDMLGDDFAVKAVGPGAAVAFS